MTHDIMKLMMYERHHDSKLGQDYRNLRNKVTCMQGAK